MSYHIFQKPTKPFSDQKPGTSGLRKSTVTFLQENYTENFIQCIFNCLRGRIGMGDSTLILGGDGRYHNKYILSNCIIPMAAANGVVNLIIGLDGLLSTPAASHLIRMYGADGGILLTASHNPGGLNNDFGIKFNTSNGGPSEEKVTAEIYNETLQIESYKTLTEIMKIDLSQMNTYSFDIEDMPQRFTVKIVDSVDSYCKYLQKIFDFPSIISITTGADDLRPFNVVADCMNGVMGPYVKKILVEKLKVPQNNVIRGIPLEDFGCCHPDPNLTYASELVHIMATSEYDFGCAFDGDGDRNMILGSGGFFINPSDALAIIADNARLIPYFRRKGILGFARSMPTSSAVDKVAQKNGVPLFEVPTGWKFFGNLMDAHKLSLCGEESFGMGSNHIREKDGLWSVLAWLSVIASLRHEQRHFVTLTQIVESHWIKYGRNYYTRYDYENCNLAHSVEMMNILNDMILNRFTVGSVFKLNEKEFNISICDNFSYRDPVDERVSENQGIRIIFSDGSRIIFRISGTSSSGVTVRIYIDYYERDPNKIQNQPSEKLKPLIDLALSICQIERITGRDLPTVITLSIYPVQQKTNRVVVPNQTENLGGKIAKESPLEITNCKRKIIQLMMNQREVVTLHFGQAGIQLGNAVWETMVTEHGIKANGLTDLIDVLLPMDLSAIKSFFHFAPSGHYIPRALIVDSEPTVIDEIRTGYYRQLFHPDLLLSGVEDAANNFARGYYTIGRKMLHGMIDRVRFIVESCDNLRGFMSYSGSGGGTGSGLYSLLVDRIMLEYTGKTLFGTMILPGKTMNDTVVDPLNTVLRMSQNISTDLNVLMDNESMHQICYNMLNVLRPTYTNLNRLAAPILASISAPFRFQGPLGSDLSDISTNLIPFPRINFPTLAYSPFISNESLDHSLLTSDQLLRDVFEQDHNLLGLNLQKGKLMSSVLTFRGIHQMNDVINRLGAMKNENIYKWVDWCPTGFKISQTLYPSVHHFSSQPQSSLMMMCNHSGVSDSIGQLCHKFSMLFKKQSFVHWFVAEGMEANEMLDAVNNVIFLKQDYDEVCFDKERINFTTVSDTGSSVKSLRSNSSHQKSDVKKTVSTKSSNKNIPDFATINTPIETKESKASSSKRHSDKKKNDSMKSFDRKKYDSVLRKNSKEINENRPWLQMEAERASQLNLSPEKSSPNHLKISQQIKSSDSYELSARSKEIIFDNVTSLSPEMRQRLLGYVE